MGGVEDEVDLVALPVAPVVEGAGTACVQVGLVELRDDEGREDGAALGALGERLGGVDAQQVAEQARVQEVEARRFDQALAMAVW